jgi:hypothetical protein
MFINPNWQRLSGNAQTARVSKIQIMTCNDQLLVVKRNPIWAWRKLAAVLIYWTVAVLLNYFSGGFAALRRLADSHDLVRLMIPLIVGTSIVQVFGLLRAAKVKIYKFDKLAGELTIDSRNLWHGKSVKYPLPECQGAIVESVPANQFWTYYQITLLLSADRVMPLTHRHTVREVPSITIADTINEFLGVQPPIEG